MDQKARFSALALLLILTQGHEALARRCADNPRIPAAMMAAIANLQPTWNDFTYTSPGGDAPWPEWEAAREVFTRACKGCHHMWEVNPSDARTTGIATFQYRLESSDPNVRMPAGGRPALSAADKQTIYTFLNSTQPTTPSSVYNFLGIKHLFTADGVCMSCHSTSAPSATYPTANTRFNTCANCHASAKYPGWLRLDDPSTHRLKSYYLPGLTKEHAIQIRTQDGTMPPGAAAKDEVPNWNDPVSWCDELQTKYFSWVFNGMGL